MPCDRRGIVRRGEKGRQWEYLPGKEKPSLNNSVPGQLVCGSRQRKIFRKLPFELRPDASSGRLKDQRTVPFSPGSADESLAFFHCLPGNHQHRPADKVCVDHRTCSLCPQAMERSGGDLRHRFGFCRFQFQPPIQKIQADPRELTALQQSIFPGGKFFLRDDTARHQENGFPQNGSCPRLLAGRQAGSIHSPDKALGPKQKRHKQQKPGPQPPPPEVGPQEKKQPCLFADAQMHPPLAGKFCQPEVTPCRTSGCKAAGSREDVSEMQACPCSFGEQAIGITVPGRKCCPGPKL